MSILTVSGCSYEVPFDLCHMSDRNLALEWVGKCRQKKFWVRKIVLYRAWVAIRADRRGFVCVFLALRWVWRFIE